MKILRTIEFYLLVALLFFELCYMAIANERQFEQFKDELMDIEDNALSAREAIKRLSAKKRPLRAAERTLKRLAELTIELDDR